MSSTELFCTWQPSSLGESPSTMLASALGIPAYPWPSPLLSGWGKRGCPPWYLQTNLTATSVAEITSRFYQTRKAIPRKASKTSAEFPPALLTVLMGVHGKEGWGLVPVFSRSPEFSLLPIHGLLKSQQQ